MNFLDHTIGFEDEQIFSLGRFNDRAVIAGTSNDLAPNRQFAQQQREKRVFANLA
jgi:hypothetical protein